MAGVILAVVGCRQYDDYEYAFSVIDKYIDYHKLVIEKIISGDAPGVDQIAEDYAISRGYAFECHPADWDTHGGAAGFIRNDLMSDICTHTLAFWDKASHGTKHMIDSSLKKRRLTTTVKIELTKKRYYSARWKKIYAERNAETKKAA